MMMKMKRTGEEEEGRRKEGRKEEKELGFRWLKKGDSSFLNTSICLLETPEAYFQRYISDQIHGSNLTFL